MPESASLRVDKVNGVWQGFPVKRSDLKLLKVILLLLDAWETSPISCEWR